MNLVRHFQKKNQPWSHLKLIYSMAQSAVPRARAGKLGGTAASGLFIEFADNKRNIGLHKISIFEILFLNILAT